jgi:hypothetical protein
MQMKQTEWTEKGPTRWILTSALLLVLAGCGASQSSIPSVPKPKPPTPPAEPSPTPESTETQASKPTPPEAPEAPETEATQQGPRPDAGSETTGDDGTQSPPASAGESSGEAGEAGDASGGGGGMPPGTMTDDEQGAALDGRLSSSLSEFDGIILKEQELLDARREAAGAGGGGGSAAGGSGNGAGESGEEGLGSDGGSGMSRRGGVTTGGSPDAPPEATEVTDEGGSPVETGMSQTTNGRVPPDVGDGHDDDIVARQLREAAMKEEDPELREKLWEEYRKYKGGTESK